MWTILSLNNSFHIHLLIDILPIGKVVTLDTFLLKMLVQKRLQVFKNCNALFGYNYISIV